MKKLVMILALGLALGSCDLAYNNVGKNKTTKQEQAYNETLKVGRDVQEAYVYHDKNPDRVVIVAKNDRRTMYKLDKSPNHIHAAFVLFIIIFSLLILLIINVVDY
jgi:hypothetical protein